MVGNAEKSSGRSMNRVIVKMRIASPKDIDRPMSKTHDGMGSIIITMIAIKAKAMNTVEEGIILALSI